LASEHDRLKEAILKMLSAASDQRVRPHELENALSHKLEISRDTVHQAVKNLVQEGRLRFTCHDPTSYLGVPEAVY
jgi:DNA-binding GntR family transcriptional regulator